MLYFYNLDRKGIVFAKNLSNGLDKQLFRELLKLKRIEEGLKKR